MTVSVIFADTTDGQIDSNSAVDYATARTGGTKSVNTAAATFNVGQTDNGIPIWDCYEGFVQFDTSAIGSGTVTVATLDLWGNTDVSTQDFTLHARVKDWGPGLDSGDWVSGASLTGLTLLATFATSGFSTTGYNTFTSDANFISNINGSGSTRIILHSDRHSGNNAPASGVDEYVAIKSANTAGTTNDPKLTVTWTAPPSGGTLPMMGI